MSEISDFVDLAQAHDTSTLLTAAGLYSAHKVFGGSLKVIGSAVTDFTSTQIENLKGISAKIPEEAKEKPWAPHPRTTARVLNCASLYDDDLMQTYVAGLITGSRNSDGSDDRPVFYLTLIDGMTAEQLRYFHVFYRALSHLRVDHNKHSYVSVNERELERNVALIAGGEPPEDPRSAVAVLSLEGLGLISHTSITYTEDRSDLKIKYKGTRLGMLLFDWAHGISDEDIAAFNDHTRDDLGLPELSFDTASVDQ